MTVFKEYTEYDAVGLAELIQNQEVSAAEVLDAAIAQAERLNPTLNAIVDYFPDKARASLQQLDIDRPFAGVPMLIKDYSDVAGHSTTHGSRLFQDNPATRDCELVNKFREAGLIIFGKTNVPEFGLNASTEGVLWGACKNPWNLTHSCGGSSGGSAAAVAAGIVPMAHATDGGGSIRIPASCCGLFGLKPSRGLISFSPYLEGWGGLDHMHVMTRSVRDSAALLDESAGYVAGDFHRTTVNSDTEFGESFLAATQIPLKRPLKIGFTTTSPSGSPVHADCVEAVQRTVKQLQQLGHSVEERSPTYNATDLAFHCSIIGMSFVRALINSKLQILGRTLQPGEIEIATQSLLDVMQHTTAADYASALMYLNQTSRQIATFYEQYDLWLTPTLAQPPAKLGYLFCDKTEDAFTFFDRILNYTPFTGMANATGLPAMTVPLHWNKDNLPVGVHFVGRSGEEALMFALAAQLERANPWAEKYRNLL